MKKKMEKEATPKYLIQEEDKFEVIEEESTVKRVLNTVVNVILVLAIALAAVCTYVSYVSSSGNGVPSVFGIRMFSIQTESMYPELLPGDLIFDTGVKDAGELRKGDVITYWTVINGERVLNTHRIHEIYDGGGYLIFATKGDNNTAADALTVHESEIVGKYSFRVAGLGKVFDYLQTSTGFLIVVVIPVFLFFLFHLIQFFRVLFEYQNVKNRIKFEQERGRTEDLIEEQKRQQKAAQAQARAKMEAELRERLRAEIMASMASQQKPQEEHEVVQSAPNPVKEETPAPAVEEVSEVEAAPDVEEAPVAESVSVIKEESTALEAPAAEEKTVDEASPAADETSLTDEAPKAEKPVMDEAAIEAMIAKQRAAIEAELREKLRAEFLAAQQNDKVEKNVEDTSNV